MLKVNIKSISIRNNGHKTSLLRDINFELERGNIYTIIGENGAGKSTLIKALTSLLNENLFSVEGTVHYEDKELYSCSSEELRLIRLNNIRYVFQDAVNSFDPLKTFEYYFNTSIEQEELNNLLNYFLLPNYSKLSSLYPYEISGGMAQRISIVLALLANPDLIILDEPTSGIDYAISNLLLLKLKEFAHNKNGTILTVTHEMSFAQKISDETAMLSGGRLSKFETSSDFFSRFEAELDNAVQNDVKSK